MKSTKSIWLGEYEGLLPVLAGDCEPGRDLGNSDPRLTPAHDPVSPHFELTTVQLAKSTPTAFFE